WQTSKDQGNERPKNGLPDEIERKNKLFFPDFYVYHYHIDLEILQKILSTISTLSGKHEPELKSFSPSIKRQVMHHAIFWLGYFLINTFRWGSYFDDYWYSLQSNLVEFPIHLVLVYFNL